MIKDTIYTLLTRSFYIVGKLIYFVLIIRYLGPTLKGVFELISLAPNVLAQLGNLGFNQANIYFSGRRPESIPRLISNTYFLTLVFSIPAIALGVGYMLLPVTQKNFEHVPMWAGFLALAVVPIAILDMLLEGILYGEDRIWVRNVHSIIQIVCQVVYIGIFVLGLQWAVQGVILGYILVAATLFAFTFSVLRRFHKPVAPKWHSGLARESWMFGRFTWGANFASFLFYKIDILLLSAFYVPLTGISKYVVPADVVLEQVGLYTTAVSAITTIWIIPDAIQTALLPKITRKGEAERRKLVPPSLRAVTLLVILAMILMALIAKPALHVLGNRPDALWDYREAYIPLMLLMPGIFTLSLAKVFTADFFSRGKPHYAMWVSIISLVLNVMLNLNLIPMYGMYGAAIASSVSYTFSFLVFLYIYIRESGERSRDIFIPKLNDFALIWSWARAALVKAGENDSIDQGEGM